MVDVQIKSTDVANLVHAIKKHTDAKAIRSELYRGLNSATKDVREEMKESTADPVNLPTAGGLQGLMVAGQSVKSSVIGGRHAGVRIRATGKKGAPAFGVIYRTGRVYRPTFGRGKFKLQSEGVKPRWMDPVFEAQRPVVQRAIQGVLEEIARKVLSK